MKEWSGEDRGDHKIGRCHNAGDDDGMEDDSVGTSSIAGAEGAGNGR